MGVDLSVEEHLMAGREGIILRALGDGQQYVVQLTQGLSPWLSFVAGRLPSKAQHADMSSGACMDGNAPSVLSALPALFVWRLSGAAQRNQQI